MYNLENESSFVCPLDGTSYYWKFITRTDRKELVCKNHVDIYTTIIGSIDTYLDIWLNDHNVTTSYFGTRSNDLVDLNDKDDYVPGEPFKAGRGADVVIGTDDNDDIRGQAGNDLIDGGAGDDRIVGANDDDILLGGSGNDVILGGRGNDILFGGSGNDNISGGGGTEDRAIYEGSSSDYTITKKNRN